VNSSHQQPQVPLKFHEEAIVCLAEWLSTLISYSYCETLCSWTHINSSSYTHEKTSASERRWEFVETKWLPTSRL